MVVLLSRRAGLRRRARGTQPTADLPPGVDPDPTTIWALERIADAAHRHAPGRHRRSGSSSRSASSCTATAAPRGTARDQMRWLLWGALVTAAIVAVSLFLDLGGAHRRRVLRLHHAGADRDDGRRGQPEHRLDRGPARTHPPALGRSPVVLVAVDFARRRRRSRALLDDEMDQAQVVLVVLLTTVLLYGPLRQPAVAMRCAGWCSAPGDPYDAVAGLASTLETADEGDEQLAAVARAVASAFGVGFVSVEVDRSGGERLVATYGERPAETRTLPIAYRDAEVGRLVLPARGLRSRLSRRDEELLGDLVRQAATAARTSRLAEELQDSRERLVAAREEERRRIRRDLHDGLGPALSGVVFQLESARLLVDQDPEAAKTQVAATSNHVQEVVADVRRLVHDLRPPALDDLGLVGALRQQAERLEPPAIRRRPSDLGALPAAVEVAAFRIAGEAMTNVARHAGRHDLHRPARRRRRARCVVEVADDGVGIRRRRPGRRRPGRRCASAPPSSAARSEVTCPPTGGTVVRARLPLRRNP